MDGPPLFCNLVPVKPLQLLVRTLERDKYIFLNFEKTHKHASREL